jgi:hypothetical protein
LVLDRFKYSAGIDNVREYPAASGKISFLFSSRPYGLHGIDITMTEDENRILPATGGRVQCLPGKKEPLENCGFCIHCREFRVGGKFVISPSLAYCSKCRVTERVDFSKADAVRCADHQGEGFHSITSIIS